MSEKGWWDMEGARSETTEAVGAVQEKAQEQAGQAVEKGRGVVRAQVDSRSTQVGQQARSVAETLRQTSAQLRQTGDEQQARYAHIADSGADRLDRAGRYLAESDADELLGRIEDEARRQPWLVAGVGLLLGIAAARFLKASSSERYYRSAAAIEPYRETAYGQAATWASDHELSDVEQSRTLTPAGRGV